MIPVLRSENYSNDPRNMPVADDGTKLTAEEREDRRNFLARWNKTFD